MRILASFWSRRSSERLVGGAVAYVEVRNDLDPVNELPATAGVRRVPREEVAQGRGGRAAFRLRHDATWHDEIARVRHSQRRRCPAEAASRGTSCKCTLGSADGAIRAWRSTKVKSQWSAKSDKGPFRQTATILTNDPLQPCSNCRSTAKSVGQRCRADGIFRQARGRREPAAEVYVMAMLQDDLTVNDPRAVRCRTRDNST